MQPFGQIYNFIKNILQTTRELKEIKQIKELQNVKGGGEENLIGNLKHEKWKIIKANTILSHITN